MEVRVNAEQCTGCGACVEICPNGAIQLSDGFAVLDQTICSQCQVCVDICPVGAITAVELPVAVTKPAAVQPVCEAEIVVVEPPPPSIKPWLNTALAFVGREILPRLLDALITALDRRLMQAQPAQSQVSLSSQDAERISKQNNGRGYRQQNCSNQVRHRRRRKGNGTGKRHWI
jgi:ferredoxin